MSTNGVIALKSGPPMKHESSIPELGDTVAAAEAGHYHVLSTSTFQEWRPSALKHGDTFAVFNQYGDIVSGEGHTDGLYHEDTRYLSRLELSLNGQRPLLLSSAVQNDNGLLSVDLTNREIYNGDHLILPQDIIHVSRAKFLWQDACYERIAIRNYDDEPHSIILSLLFDGDFADLFEVRGHKREERGQRRVDVRDGNSVVFSYAGLDSVERCATVHFDPAPDRLEPHVATYQLNLKPKGRSSLFFTVTCGACSIEKEQRRGFFVCFREAHKSLRRATANAATITTSNEIFNEVLCRSMSDLYMLMTETDEGPYPYAGIPWYSTAFGRDGIITAIETLWIDPQTAKGVLQFLSATQAKEHDAFVDAEPGKILHETRRGEMARLGEVPFGQYYGSVDATCLFVMLAGMYWERTGDLDTITALWPNVEAALNWIDTYGDVDGDGFVEYQRKSDKGLTNQGWKDSHDSIFHADGRLAEGPIALCEVQGYVYAAKRHAAAIARALDLSAVAATLEQQAEALKDLFNANFWCDELSTYALALDGEKKQCRVSTSNAGQVLFTGIATQEQARRVADTLSGPDFFSGWGIRTVAASESRYNPMSYHNGSIWPHDNALIALGLARYGLTENIDQVFNGLFDAATYTDLRRLPELFCGFRRRPSQGPTYYPVACSPQAWASAAPLALLQASLGLELDHQAREIRFRHPRLPTFIDEVLLKSVQLGDSRMDILLRRHASEVTVDVLNRDGDAQVIVTL